MKISGRPPPVSPTRDALNTVMVGGSSSELSFVLPSSLGRGRFDSRCRRHDGRFLIKRRSSRTSGFTRAPAQGGFSEAIALTPECEGWLATARTLTANTARTFAGISEVISVGAGNAQVTAHHVIYAVFSSTKLPHLHVVLGIRYRRNHPL